MMSIINRISTRKDRINGLYDETLAEVKELISREGGYLNTANNNGENDNIYGAVIDFNGTNELVEVMVKAIKVENGNLYCYVVPITTTPITYDDEYMKSDADNWYELSNNGNLLYHYTLDNIIDVIDYGEYFSEESLLA